MIIAEVADDIMVEAAKILQNNEDLLENMLVKIRGLDAEPNLAQIEYVTLPISPNKIEEAITLGRQLLIDAANRLGAKILARSMHPIQSDPNPIAGLHLNVSIQKKGSYMSADDMKTVYNYCWEKTPLFLAISANSPIYLGTFNGIMSNRNARSTVLKDNGLATIKVPDQQPALIPMEYYGRRRYRLKIGSGVDPFSKKIIVNTKGNRLVDISPRGPATNISGDKDDSPSVNRIEIRIFDVPSSIENIVCLANLCCFSALDAIVKADSENYVEKFNPYHSENKAFAIKSGINAQFKNNNGKFVPVQELLDVWVQALTQYNDLIGSDIKFICEKMNLEIQKDPSLEKLSINYQTKKVEQTRQRGTENVKVKFSSQRIISDKRGNKYRIPKDAEIDGKLSVTYLLNYKEEKNGIVSRFTEINIINSLQVKGLDVPIEKNDQVLRAASREDYLSRFFRGGFPSFF